MPGSTLSVKSPESYANDRSICARSIATSNFDGDAPISSFVLAPLATTCAFSGGVLHDLHHFGRVR